MGIYRQAHQQRAAQALRTYEAEMRRIEAVEERSPPLVRKQKRSSGYQMQGEGALSFLKT